MSQHAKSQRIVYLADDDKDDRVLFLEAVQDLNLPVSVVEAEDGQELLNVLFKAKFPPEVIFLDINMPGKSGFDCLAEIRNAEGNLRDVKIIMLSTSSNPVNIEMADELGADLYAVKPSSFQGLKEILKQALSTDWVKIKKNRKEFLLV